MKEVQQLLNTVEAQQACNCLVSAKSELLKG